MGLGLAIETIGGAGIGGMWRRIGAVLSSNADSATLTPFLGRLRARSAAFQACGFGRCS